MTASNDLTYYSGLESALQTIDPEVATLFFETAAAVIQYSHRRMELTHELDKINKDFEVFYKGQNMAADDRNFQKENMELMLIKLIDLSGKFPEQPHFLRAALAAFEKFVDGAPDYQQKSIDFLRDRYEHKK